MTEFTRHRPSPRPSRLRPPRTSDVGRPLDPGHRAALESRFHHNFNSVRLFADGEAARLTARLGGDAVTIGSDIFFAPDRLMPETPAGFGLLAHELTHVVQNERFAERCDSSLASVSRPGDPAEQDARAASARVVTGGEVAVTSAPTAVASPGVLDWLEETGTDVLSGASDLATDATATIGGGLETAWDATTDVASGIYEGMKFNSGLVHDAEHWAMGGIDWLEEQASGGVHGLADYAQRIPVLEDVADLGASALDQYIQFEGGVLKGATGLVGGLANIVANPVDTAIALEQMAEHVPMIPGIPNPLKAARAGYNVLSGQEDLGDAANRVLNPMASMEEDAGFMLNVGKALVNPYVQSWQAGKPAEALGRAGFDIALIVATAGGEAAVEGAGGVGRVAGELGEVSEGLRAAEVVGEASEGLRAAEVVGETSEGLRAAEVVGETSEGLRSAEVLAEGAQELRGPTVLEPHPFEFSETAESGLRRVEPRPTEFPIPETPGAGQPASGLELAEADQSRIAGEVAAEGRQIRKADIRQTAREVKQQQLAELRSEGMVSDEFIELADDIGLDRAEALAEGEMGLKEAGVEVSHEPFPLAEGPEFGDVPENLRARSQASHRRGIHGGDFNKGSEFQPVDPLFDEHAPLRGVREPGRPPMSASEIDEAAQRGALEQWPDRERAIDELIDRGTPEALAEAAEAGGPPGKGRGGPRLSPEEQLAREQAGLDRSIKGQYRGSEAPPWMTKGMDAPGVVQRQWAEAMEWMTRIFGGE